MDKGREFRSLNLEENIKGEKIPDSKVETRDRTENVKERRENRFDSNVEGKITALDFVFDAQNTELEYDDDNNPKYATVAYWQDLLFISNINKDIPKDILLNIHLVGSQGNTKEIEEHVKAVLEHSATHDSKREIVISKSDEPIASAGWIRDNAIRASNGKEIIMTSIRGFMNFERLFDLNFLQKQLVKDGQEVVSAPFYFDGENVRTADNTVFLGPNVLRNNVVFANIDNIIRRPAEEEKLLVKDVTSEAVNDVQEDIEEFLQGKTLIVGGKKYATEYIQQPLYHIDLFFTPMGDNTFAIGDTSIVVNLLKEYENDEGKISKAMLTSLEQILEKEHERLGKYFDEYIGFENEENALNESEGVDNDEAEIEGEAEMAYPMGSFELEGEYLPNMFNDSIYRQLKQSKNLNNPQNEDEVLLYEAIQFINDTQEQMSSLGSKVVKVPFIPLANPREQRGAFITYNNVLIDRGGADGKPRVFLPYYGKKRPFSNERGTEYPHDFFERLDELAYKAYADVGYEVISIGNRFDRLARNGSLNCSLLETRDYQNKPRKHSSEKQNPLSE